MLTGVLAMVASVLVVGVGLRVLRRIALAYDRRRTAGRHAVRADPVTNRPPTGPRSAVYRSWNAQNGETTTRNLWVRMRRNRHPLVTDDEPADRPNLADLWR